MEQIDSVQNRSDQKELGILEISEILSSHSLLGKDGHLVAISCGPPTTNTHRCD